MTPLYCDVSVVLVGCATLLALVLIQGGGYQ